MRAKVAHGARAGPSRSWTSTAWCAGACACAIGASARPPRQSVDERDLQDSFLKPSTARRLMMARRADYTTVSAAHSHRPVKFEEVLDLADLVLVRPERTIAALISFRMRIDDQYQVRTNSRRLSNKRATISMAATTARVCARAACRAAHCVCAQISTASLADVLDRP